MSALVEIARGDWHKLRDLYVDQKLVSTGYYLLQNFINWIEQNPKENIIIYALDGDWQSDGTYLLSIMSDTRQIYCNTLSQSLDRLTKALSLVDTSDVVKIYGFPERILPAIQQFWHIKGYCEEELRYDRTVWYHFTKDTIEKFAVSAPEGFTLSRLEMNHAQQINNSWPHRTPDSILFVEQLLRYNPSVGAFDQHGNLVAWCLQLPLGSLGLLQVENTHKRMGLGSLLVRYMSKQLMAHNIEVLSPVVVENLPSRSMFDKLGAIIVDHVYWSVSKFGKSSQA